MKNYRLLLTAACIMGCLAGNVARGFSIRAVTFSPGRQATPSDELEMTVEITTPSQPPFLYAPTQVSSNGNGIQIDIYPNSGSLAAIGLLYETITLGTFPVGTYSYEVVLHPAYQVNWGTRTNSGIFSIVGGTPPPMLALDEPQEGQQFATGDTIPLRASIANDSGGAWSVQFFSGDQPIAQSTPGRTVWWSEAWGGQHILSARASNASGTLLISDSKSILVGPGAMLPV